MLGDPRPGILHVVNSLDGGGTERALVRLLGSFDRTLFRHTVLTLRRGGALAKALPDDVACRVLATRGGRATLGPTIARIAQQERATLLHARNTCCWADATIAKCLCSGTSLVLGFHGLDHAGRFARRDRMVGATARLLGARFTSVSRNGCDKLAAELRVPRHRLQWLPNGVVAGTASGAARGSRDRIRATFGFTDSDVVVGTVGSLTDVKRHDLLLTAVGNLGSSSPRLRLLLIGDGPNRAALEAFVGRTGLGAFVRFAGRRDDVPACLGAMDVYACSSDSEGMSNALLEALATGLPILATDTGDNSLLVRHDVEGLLAPPGDAAAFTEALRYLVHDPSLRSRCARAAREASWQYDLARTARRYDDYYTSVLACRRRRHRVRHAECPIEPTDTTGANARRCGPIIPDTV